MNIPILPQSDYQQDAGRRLRKLVDGLGLTQVEAARLMGISKHVLRNWLAGDHPIQPYALYRLCRSKSIDFNYVFLGDWQHLPFALAKAMEDEMQASLVDSLVAAPPEA